jgi:hypothetical protein
MPKKKNETANERFERALRKALATPPQPLKKKRKAKRKGARAR